MTAPWKHARRQVELARRQRDKALVRLQQKPEPSRHGLIVGETPPVFAPEPVLTPDQVVAMEAIMKKAMEAFAMSILSKEMACQAHVEKTIAERYQGWQLVELFWEPATHRVRLGVRCPHGQKGVTWASLHAIVDVVDTLLHSLRAKCEEDHQQMMKVAVPEPIVKPTDDYIVQSPLSSMEVICDLRKVFPGLARMVMPPCGGPPDTVDRIIVALNDGRGWSREQIADWLDTLHEPLLTAQPTSQGD